MRHNPRLRWIIPFALGANLIGSIPPAYAGAGFRLSPPRMTFSPNGSGATRSFRIESTGDQPVAVEIHMKKRVVDINGQETQPDAEADFVVYPPQILLKPGETQTVRVTWLGDPNPSSELAYRIIAEQLPVNLPVIQQEQNGVKINLKALYVYVGSVFITPRQAAPKVVVSEAVCQATQGTHKKLALTLENQGTAHTYLTDFNLHLSPSATEKNSNNSVHLKPAELPGINGENLLASSKRQFMLPCPANFPTGSVSARIEFQTTK